MSLDQIVDGLSEVSCDVLVIGGGTAGPMAALKAKLKVENNSSICRGLPPLNSTKFASELSA